MYEVILLDLDGTLLDTLDDLTHSTNAALTAHGFKERTKDEVRAFVGNGIANLIKRAIGDPAQDYLPVLQTFKEHYAAHCADNTKPYDRILQTLKTFKEKGARCAVISNKADFAVKALCKEYFGDLIELAVGEKEAQGVRKKPAPDALFTAIKDMGAEGKSAVYVGDSDVDILTAKNAGLPCICVTWGFRDKAFLKESGGTTLVDTCDELLNACGYEK